MAQEYFITSPRYLREVGESVPTYKDASPANPRRVVLPDDTHVKTVKKHRLDERTGLRVKEEVEVVDPGLTLGSAPEKPAKAAVAGLAKEPVRKSHEPRAEKPAKDAEASKGGREADK